MSGCQTVWSTWPIHEDFVYPEGGVSEQLHSSALVVKRSVAYFLSMPTYTYDLNIRRHT